MSTLSSESKRVDGVWYWRAQKSIRAIVNGRSARLVTWGPWRKGGAPRDY